ncbi:hypothetical protein ACB098_12G004000 [Castanea mollissima]
MASSTQMCCALKVDTSSSGWHNTMVKVLKKISGVVYDIDAEEGMAYITGKADPHKILKKLVKSGKHAQLCWVEIGNQYTYSQDGSYLHPRGREPYYEDPYPYLSSYRRDSYWDGYNGPGYNSYYPHQPMPHYYPPQVPYNPYYY